MDLNFYNNFVPQTAKYDDQKYTSRGKFYTLHLDSEIIKNNIKKLNDNKVGAPFVYSDTCFMITALFRNTVGVAYRQLQGIIKDVLGKEKSPKYSAIYKRINKINLEDDNGKSWFSDGKTKTEIVFLSGDRQVSSQLVEVIGWVKNGT